MGMKRRFVGCLFVLFGSVGLISACGADDDACETKEDCGDDQICSDDGICEDPVVVTGCKAKEDCTDDEVCVIPEGEEAGECKIVDVDPVYFTVLVKDVSTGDSCTDTSYKYNTPGSQITYVRLENAETNDVVAYGTAIGSTIVGESDFTDVEGVLNGETPAFADAEDFCVAIEDYTDKDGGKVGNGAGFRKDSGVALGCGGELYVTFKVEGVAKELDESNVVRVGEYDAQCDDRFKGTDHYEVYLCEGAGSDVAELDCTRKISGDDALTGLRDAVEISLPEVLAAE